MINKYSVIKLQCVNYTGRMTNINNTTCLQQFFLFLLVPPSISHPGPLWLVLHRPDGIPTSSWSCWQPRGPSMAAGSCWSRRAWATRGSGRCFRPRISNTSLWMINTALFTATYPRLVTMRLPTLPSSGGTWVKNTVRWICNFLPKLSQIFFLNSVWLSLYKNYLCCLLIIPELAWKTSCFQFSSVII